MNLIFLGTPAFAVPTLKALTRTDHIIKAVITQPDRPSGRGMRFAPPPVKEAALRCGLLVMQPDDASSPSILREIQSLEPEVAIVVAYGQILKRRFLDAFPCGCINLHPSLLPRYRGPTPIQSAILAGDRITGVTTILLDEGTDTGDILLQREVEILEADTAGSLHDRLSETGADLVLDTLAFIQSPDAVYRSQDDADATVTRKIEKQDAIIDWTRPAGRIRDLVRAMDPWPGAQTMLNGSPLKVWKVEPCKGDVGGVGEPGEVLATEPGLVVRTGTGLLRIVELQASGKKRMPAEDFMRGYRIDEATTLGK